MRGPGSSPCSAARRAATATSRPLRSAPTATATGRAGRVASGRGTLQSWVAFHRAYWPGFGPDLPYDVCLVRLEEGPLMVSSLVGGTAGAKLGAAVTVVFDPVADDLTLPKWTLAGT